MPFFDCAYQVSNATCTVACSWVHVGACGCVRACIVACMARKVVMVLAVLWWRSGWLAVSVVVRFCELSVIFGPGQMQGFASGDADRDAFSLRQVRERCGRLRGWSCLPAFHSPDCARMPCACTCCSCCHMRPLGMVVPPTVRSRWPSRRAGTILCKELWAVRRARRRAVVRTSTRTAHVKWSCLLRMPAARIARLNAAYVAYVGCRAP